MNETSLELALVSSPVKWYKRPCTQYTLTADLLLFLCALFSYGKMLVVN